MPLDWSRIEAQAKRIDDIVEAIIELDEELYHHLQFGDVLPVDKQLKWAKALPELNWFFDKYANMYEAY